MTGGCVSKASGIAKQRFEAGGRVATAGGEAKKSRSSLCRVAPGVASIWRRIDGMSSGQERKVGKHEQNCCEWGVSVFHRLILLF